MIDYIQTARPAGINESRDCTVRALSNALGISYHEAHSFLANAGRKPKHGARMKEIVQRRRGQILGHKLTLVKRSGSLGKFVREFSIGRYLVTVRAHAFAVVDGAVQDMEPQATGRHILRAWRVD